MICFYLEVRAGTWAICLIWGPTFLRKVMLDINMAWPDSRRNTSVKGILRTYGLMVGLGKGHQQRRRGPDSGAHGYPLASVRGTDLGCSKGRAGRPERSRLLEMMGLDQVGAKVMGNDWRCILKGNMPIGPPENSTAAMFCRDFLKSNSQDRCPSLCSDLRPQDPGPPFLLPLQVCPAESSPAGL